MRSERDQSSYWTKLVINRLGELCARLERPATLDELLDEITEGSGVPWTYVGQLYQARMCQVARLRKKISDRSDEAAPVTNDSDLGARYERFDIHDPTDRRRALRYAVTGRLNDSQGKKARRWALRHGDPGDWRWELNPDEHLQVVVNGKRVEWNNGARVAADAALSAAVAVVSHTSSINQALRADPAAVTIVLRWIASIQPTYKRGNSATERQLLSDVRKATGDDPVAALRWARDYLNARLPSPEP